MVDSTVYAELARGDNQETRLTMNTPARRSNIISLSVLCTKWPYVLSTHKLNYTRRTDICEYQRDSQQKQMEVERPEGPSQQSTINNRAMITERSGYFDFYLVLIKGK